jgi:ABC-type bacteriocin/lantibiotic exporter with double-glycine peptidase domain
MRHDREDVHSYHVPLRRSAAECAPAALLGVLRFWGGDAPLSTVVRMCSEGDPEMPLQTLARVARELGFQAVEVRSDLGEIRDFVPCIVQLHTSVLCEHCVIVYRINDQRVLIGDPTIGLRRIDVERFSSLWITRLGLLLRPAEPVNAPQFGRISRNWMIQ